MEKKMMLAVALAVLVIISCNTVVVESDASDCYDSCSTACVNPDRKTFFPLSHLALQGYRHVVTASAALDVVQLIKPMGIWIEVFQCIQGQWSQELQLVPRNLSK